MSERQTFLFPEAFIKNNGVYFQESFLSSESLERKQLWDDIADNWVITDYRTEPIRGVMESFVENTFFDTILELGCGFGRGAHYLSTKKNISCNHYYATDISEKMLRRLVSYRKKAPFFEKAELCPICLPVGKLPFEDNSVDLVFSDSVFMHVGYRDFEVLINEIKRVLKPQGKIFFPNSFHNKKNPVHFLRQVVEKLLWKRTPYSENYSRSGILEKLADVGLSDKSSALKIEVSHHQIFPGILTRSSIFKFLNQLIGHFFSKHYRDEVLAFAYSVYSPELLKQLD